MQSYKSLNNINQIIDNYDAFIIDIWGVLWDGIEAYKYAKLTLKKLKEKIKISFFFPMLLEELK